MDVNFICGLRYNFGMENSNSQRKHHHQHCLARMGRSAHVPPGPQRFLRHLPLLRAYHLSHLDEAICPVREIITNWLSEAFMSLSSMAYSLDHRARESTESEFQANPLEQLPLCSVEQKFHETF